MLQFDTVVSGSRTARPKTFVRALPLGSISLKGRYAEKEVSLSVEDTGGGGGAVSRGSGIVADCCSFDTGSVGDEEFDPPMQLPNIPPKARKPRTPHPAPDEPLLTGGTAYMATGHDPQRPPRSRDPACAKGWASFAVVLLPRLGCIDVSTYGCLLRDR